MSTKVSKPKASKFKKPSALVLQEQINAILPEILGDRFRKMIEAAETQVTKSGIPASAAPKALAEIVDNELDDMQSIIAALVGTINNLKPEAIQSNLQRFRK